MAKRISITDALKIKAQAFAIGLMSRVRPVSSTSKRPPAFRTLSLPLPYGVARKGSSLLAGQWSFGGQTIEVGAHGHPFSISLPSERFAQWVHSFDWLPDLLATPGGQAKAAQLTTQWIDAFPGGSLFVFSPDMLSRRLLNWGLNLDRITDVGGVVSGRYAGQVRHLRRVHKQASPGLSSLQSQAALIMYAARLAEKGDAPLVRALDALAVEVDEQILPDGGHISRSPSATAEALSILLAVDQVLQGAGLEGSRSLDRSIDRLMPMVATLRHTDGGLGLFHGGSADNAKRIEALLSGRSGRPQAFAYGPHSGYHRLQAGGTVVLIDTGTVPPRPYDLDAHLAPLSTEISTADGRLLTNCGWHPGASPAWKRPVRSSAAHSGLTLADRSPGEILEKGFLANTLGHAVLEDPDNVNARRKEQSSGIWLESSHDGYKNDYGLVHSRRLFVAESGDDIRGEDSLFVPAGDIPLSRDAVPFALRFHFHPDVRVSLAQDLSSALLVQKGRAGWRFRTDGGPLVVEPSVYLGENARPVRCQQLVISGRALCDGDGQGRENRVRWSFRRLRGRDT